MTEYTRPHAMPSAAPRGRWSGPRRLAAALLVAPVVALAACSGEEPITATTMAPTTEDAAAATTEATTSTTTEETPTSAEASPTTKGLSVQIKDPDLGHVISPKQMVRNVKWPEGNPVGEASFEIIAIDMEIKAGSRYTATLGRGLFTLGTSTNPETPIVTEFGDLLGKPLPNASRGETTRGWVYFKVDRGTGAAVTLKYNRPAYEVSTTDKNIAARTFSAKLS